MSSPAQTTPASPSLSPSPAPEARSLKELSSQQWKSGIAAWLGWLFDGLDMHLYTLVAAQFVAELLLVKDPASATVKEHSAYIQAAFLVGWALGGGFFGRLGDLLGRSRALSLTILTYACFTGLSFFAQTWWQLMIFRFVAALGIGGEWAVGSTLLAETWPSRWRPWIAAVLQTGVNLGVLMACGAVYLLADEPPRYVFLVGIIPAGMVFWIRRSVAEPEEWSAAKKATLERPPGVMDLFRQGVRRTTFITILVCASSLTAWWAFMFWHVQYLRSLPELASWEAAAKTQIATLAFFLVIGASIAGNFFAGALARQWGYRRAIALMSLGFLGAMTAAFAEPHGYKALVYGFLPTVGFFSGMFGLFTMYLPPLFPTLLRTTGAGFCYNIGRIAAAGGTIYSAVLARNLDLRGALLAAGGLYALTILGTYLLPKAGDHHTETAA